MIDGKTQNEINSIVSNPGFSLAEKMTQLSYLDYEKYEIVDWITINLGDNELTDTSMGQHRPTARRSNFIRYH